MEGMKPSQGTCVFKHLHSVKSADDIVLSLKSAFHCTACRPSPETRNQLLQPS